MTKLLDKKEFDRLTKEQVIEQIEMRNNLLKEMVGWLYPSILQDEISILKELRPRS